MSRDSLSLHNMQAENPLKVLRQLLARMHENTVLCRMTENVLHQLNLLAHAQIGPG